MNRQLIRHGFVLILLALLAALFIPAMALPRLGVSAHTIGILGGVLLIAIGTIWQQFSLSPRQATLLYGSWLYASYVNWLGCLVGAIVGAGRMTPVASGGAVASPLNEGLVAVMLISVGLASLLAVGLSIWGLRSPRASAG